MTERSQSEASSQASDVTIAGHYSAITLPEPSPERPFVYINMVTSVDGKATVEGSERGLGSADDKRMMQELRSHADAVLNGASTLRISGSSPRIRDEALQTQRRERGLAPQPLGVLISRSGELPLDATFFTSRQFDAAVFLTDRTPRDRVEAVRATGRRVVIVSDGPNHVIQIMTALRRDLGVRYLLCEGGPTLNQSLIAAGVADELFLTLAPWIVAGAESLTAVEGAPFNRRTMPRLKLMQQLHDQTTDELYLRYAIEYQR